MLTRTRWPYPRILAHRGAGVLAPENTLVALRLGATFGFAGVEVDVRLAADDTAVLMHDAEVDRTTDGTGEVRDLDADTLRKLDAGVWFGNEFAGEQVPTLDAASALCRGQGQWMNLEIKAETGDESDAGRLIAAQAARLWAGTSPLPLLSSFSEPVLQAAAGSAPELPRGLLFDDLPADWIDRARALRCTSVHCRHDTLTAERIAAAHEAGLGVLAYTVNDTERALTLFGAGLDALVTDELREIRADFLALYSPGPR